MSAATNVDAIAETQHAGHGDPGTSWFRPDVDGLRAVAIILVVAFHAGLPMFGGGFIGVDVFFVISGFLISRNLLREHDTTERVDLRSFWARRIRRLVPGLALVVLVTLIAGYWLLPIYNLTTFAKQGAAASLYLSNMYFAVEAQDYFLAEAAPSPFLHTWSLGVEEQFYVLWPLVFFGAAFARRRRQPSASRARSRGVLATVFGITLVASFALNLALTSSGSSWAFFGLPTRAWEFAVAGLLATVTVPAVLRSRVARMALGAAGLAVLGVGIAVISDATAYPGAWALIPVVGTVLVILAGDSWDGTMSASPVSGVLALRPMQWLGRVSYSWYLWHWPFVVLIPIALDNDEVSVKVAAVLAALPVAWAAYRFVETPLRFAPILSRSVGRTYLAGAAITTVMAVTAGFVWFVSPTIDDIALPTALPKSSPMDERVAQVVALYAKRNETACPKVGGIETADGDTYCVSGDLSSDRQIMLLGDSHAGQWRQAFEAVAQRRGLKLLIRQRNGCTAYDVDVVDPKTRVPRPACALVAEGDRRILDALKPDAVFVATWTGVRNRLADESGIKETEEEQAQLWIEAAARLYDQIDRIGAAPGLIIDEPHLPINPVDCLTAKQEIAACEVERDAAMMLSGPLIEAERRFTQERGIPTIDMAQTLCSGAKCKLEEGDTLIYVDEHHLSDPYAASQVDQIDGLVERVMAKSGR